MPDTGARLFILCAYIITYGCRHNKKWDTSSSPQNAWAAFSHCRRALLHVITYARMHSERRASWCRLSGNPFTKANLVQLAARAHAHTHTHARTTAWRITFHTQMRPLKRNIILLFNSDWSLDSFTSEGLAHISSKKPCSIVEFCFSHRTDISSGGHCCDECRDGRTQNSSTVRLPLPPGAHDGMQLWIFFRHSWLGQTAHYSFLNIHP